MIIEAKEVNVWQWRWASQQDGSLWLTHDTGQIRRPGPWFYCGLQEHCGLGRVGSSASSVPFPEKGLGCGVIH